MSSRIVLALVSTALFVGSLNAQQMRTFPGARTPAPHFGAATHPLGPMRTGAPAATSGAPMFVPAPRKFVRNSYSQQFGNRYQFNSFHGSSFRGCYFNVNCRHFHRRVVYGYPVIYPYPVYTDAYYENPPQEQAVYEQPAYDDSSAQTREELARLNYEIEQLRADRESAKQTQSTREEPPVKDLGPITPTILVFSDGRRMEIHNYAIVGKMVYIVSDHTATQKIPIAQLDLPATKKANDDNGVDFVVP